MGKSFIIVITEHRKFGIIFSSYIISKGAGNSFYSSIERANLVNIKDEDFTSDAITDIQTLISQYDDINIANFFTKKKEDAVEFIKNVREDLINDRIRPFIENRLHKIIKLLAGSDIGIYYKDKNYATIYSADKVEFTGDNATAVFNFNKTEDGLQYFLNINYNNKSVSLKNKKALVLTHEPCTILLGQQMYRFKHIDNKKLQPFFTKDFVQIPKASEKVYFEKFVSNAIKQFKVKHQGFHIVDQQLTPKPTLYLQNDLQGRPVLLLKLQYGQKLILANNPELMFLQLNYSQDKVEFIKTKRDFSSENNTSRLICDLGLKTSDHVHYYLSELEKSDDALYEFINWVNNQSEFFKENDIEIKQEFFDNNYLLQKVSAQITIEESNDWFDIKGYVQLGEFKIAFLKLRKNIIKKIREYKLPDDTIAILPIEWFAKYKELFAFAEEQSGSLILNKMHFGLIAQSFEGVNGKKFGNIQDLFNKQFDVEASAPIGLNAQLRPYQLAGFNWMKQLKDNNFGGCLADDMGLGKTLQTLTLLLEVSKEKVETPVKLDSNNLTQLNLFDQPVAESKELSSPTSIIVMPASLVHNWYNEISKFTPQLKALAHTGPNRTKSLYRLKNYDIILTTYGVIRNDAELLSLFPFHYLILDESQSIKNPDSKNYKSVMKIKSKHKLVLTGTPIENRLSDLWSQINFVNRGLLGNFNFFKREFAQPIEKYKDEGKSEKLQALIHPFILRRTKDEVAKDLPLKIEQVRLCEMSSEQAKLYDEEKSAVRNSIFEKMESLPGEKKSMRVLAAITRLRQLANHPKLINSELASGKFKEVTRMLENVISEGHKVLIFSSFVEHLVIYENYLKSKDYKYSILTGKTSNRERVIEQFQTDEQNQVFLISLKAGGVGLNLTAADYVFLLDPWWNPASENQAINRAHRIGQERSVFVYRFISANSIEEKIIQLQEKKSDLANQFVNTNNPFAEFSSENLQELFG